MFVIFFFQQTFQNLIENQLFLQLSFHALPQLEEGNRIVPILKSFSKEAVSNAYDADKNKGNVNIDDLDKVDSCCFVLYITVSYMYGYVKK